VEGISRLIVSFVVATVVRGYSWLFLHRSSDLQNLPPSATSSLPSACYFFRIVVFRPLYSSSTKRHSVL
jgi:hypothetical protein